MPTSSVTIRWGAVSGATGYRVERYNSSSQKWVYMKTVTDTSYTNTGLTAGTSYQYRVRALGSGSATGDWSDTFTAFAKCDKVTMNSTYTAKSNQITFSWNKVNGADGYKVYRYNSGTGKWDRIATVASGVTSRTDKGHNPNSKHTYAVQAYKNYNGAQCHGEMSNPLYTVCAPAQVTIGSGFGYTTSSVTVRWSKVTGATGYEIYRYNTSTSKWDLVGTVNSGSTTSFTNTGLTAGNSYRYIVRAFSKQSDGNVCYGYFSSELNAFAICSKPTISSSSTARTGVRINWTKVNGADGYKVYRYKSEEGKWVMLADVSANTTSYLNSNLRSGTPYHYKVQAYKKYNGSPCHSALSDQYDIATNPENITLSVSKTTQNSITVKWNSTYGTGYEVCIYKDGTRVSYAKVGNTVTSYTFKNLSQNTKYDIKVRAYVVSGSRTIYGAFGSLSQYTSMPSCISSQELEIFEAVNEARVANGSGELTLDTDLCKVADTRAKEIGTSFSHTRPDGTKFYTAVDEMNISYTMVGENIAQGSDDASLIMKLWMNSQLHRENILNSVYTRIGIGYDSSTASWVQIFAY